MTSRNGVRILYVILIIGFIFAIFSVFNTRCTQRESVYGRSESERINFISNQVKELEREIDNLKSKNSVLLLLVVLALILNVATFSVKILSYLSKRKKETDSKELE